MQLDSTAISRFWPKVSKTDSCWTWTGSRTSKGYGIFCLEGKKKRAHQIAYILSVGPIPEGLQLDHLCRNTSCVNPSHLEPVTSRENSLRGIAANPRAIYGPKKLKDFCIHGHPYSGENLYIVKTTGRRSCRACAKMCAKKCNENGTSKKSRDRYLKRQRLKKFEAKVLKLRQELGMC